MATTVINLFAGPGAGKSTLAAGLFHEMKLMGKSVELVREYVKNWAWEGRKIKPLDQFYITAKQFRAESILYGKVDYIITDSPVILGAFYDQYYNQTNILMPSLERLFEYTDLTNIIHKNYYVKRNKKYVAAGRYETEDQAVRIDECLRTYLECNSVDLINLDVDDNQKIDFILKDLGIDEK